MDRIPRGVAKRAVRTALGAAIGSVVLAGLVFAVMFLAPARQAGQVLLLFTVDQELGPDAGMYAGGGAALRAEVVQMLESPDFLSSLVLDETLPLSVATELSDTLAVSFAERSGAMLEMTAQGMDADALGSALDAVAGWLVDYWQRRGVLREDARLREIESVAVALDVSDASATEALADVRLPRWARSAALALGQLDAERFGLVLPGRLGVPRSPETMQSLADLDARIARLEQSVGGTPAVLRSHLAAARALAGNDAIRTHLLRARMTAEQALTRTPPLRIVQSSRVSAMPIHVRRVLWSALIGAAVGALLAFLRDFGRPDVRPTRDGPTLETHLHVPVLGSLPVALRDFADRNGRSLAAVHTGHIGLQSIRSLLTALSVSGWRAGRTGPIIMADIDEAGHAGHALANLATMAADAGLRVLVVEAGAQGAVLEHLFTPGTSSPRAQSLVDSEDNDSGRIRFVMAADAAPTEPPVPGAFMHYFDCVMMRAYGAKQGAQIAGLYDGSRGVLVGHHDVPIRTWQDERDCWRDAGDSEALLGLVHGGHPMAEHRYDDREE